MHGGLGGFVFRGEEGFKMRVGRQESGRDYLSCR